MSVIALNKTTNEEYLFCKGAPEVMKHLSL
jgi:magnesium-transporting ATPase (P-type)